MVLTGFLIGRLQAKPADPSSDGPRQAGPRSGPGARDGTHRGAALEPVARTPGQQAVTLVPTVPALRADTSIGIRTVWHNRICLKINLQQQFATTVVYWNTTVVFQTTPVIK